MPDKIKSKDLQYDSSLPPFLQRLHDQSAGRGDADRHERAIARPKKAKDPSDDDGPTVIDENGETLTQDELQKLQAPTPPSDSENVKGETDLTAEPLVSGAIPKGEPTEDSRRLDSKITDGAAQKKRKVAKVVAEDEAAGDKQEDDTGVNRVVKKVKKKAKPTKLAFDEDDEGS